MEPQLSPTAAIVAKALLIASCCSWVWVAWKIGRRQNPLPFEPLPQRNWDLESLPAWLGYKADKLLPDLLLGLCAFVVAAFPILKLQELLTQWFPYEHPMIDALLKHRDLNTLLTVGIGAVVMAPFGEEMVFRVVIQGILEWFERRIRLLAGFSAVGTGSGIVPIVVSSLLFALAHLGQGAAPVPLFFFALVLGYLYFQTHRIVPSMAAHACLNAFSLALVWTSTFTPPAERTKPLENRPPAVEAVASPNAVIARLNPPRPLR